MVEWSIVSKKSLIIGLCAGVLAIAFEAMSVSTAMPAAAADLGQKELYAWVFSLFVIGMMATTVIGGRISDRYGPVIPLYVGFGVFGLGLFVSGFAPAMAVLLIGRTLQGIGSGLINIGWAVVLAHAFDASERPRTHGPVLHVLGGPVLRRPADLGLVDANAGLALGVLLGGTAPRRGRGPVCPPFGGAPPRAPVRRGG